VRRHHGRNVLAGRHVPDRQPPGPAPAVTAPVLTAIRVVIADDHPMYRYGLAAVLTGQPGIELAGEAASGIELLQVVRTTRPDVVVTDLAMPGLAGAQAAAALLAEQPEVAVLVLTMHQDDDSCSKRYAREHAGTCSRARTGPN
jgi:DNA-binding NarL/FixJ family response regulator